MSSAKVTTDIRTEPVGAAVEATDETRGMLVIGRLRLSYDTLLSNLPIYFGLVVIWLYFNSQTAGKFISARNLSEMAQEYSYKPVLALGVVLVLVQG